MRFAKVLLLTVAVSGFASAFSSGAMAQAWRSAIEVPSSQGVPEFRDPITGRVWTPETVGQDGRPLAGPEDKAFDPMAQNVPAMITEQRVWGRPVGTVPVTAGPAVPIVMMDNASLRAVPGKRWQMVMYVNNNSANPVNPIIECRFWNGSNSVMTTRATVAQMPSGTRQGLAIYGPPIQVFVDHASCNVISP